MDEKIKIRLEFGGIGFGFEEGGEVFGGGAGFGDHGAGGTPDMVFALGGHGVDGMTLDETFDVLDLFEEVADTKGGGLVVKGFVGGTLFDEGVDTTDAGQEDVECLGVDDFVAVDASVEVDAKGRTAEKEGAQGVQSFCVAFVEFDKGHSGLTALDTGAFGTVLDAFLVCNVFTCEFHVACKTRDTFGCGCGGGGGVHVHVLWGWVLTLLECWV